MSTDGNDVHAAVGAEAWRGFDVRAETWYNMVAEVRIAQGCFVSSQRNSSQTDSFALVGKQPCIIARTRVLPSGFSTVGSVDSAGLFAYKE